MKKANIKEIFVIEDREVIIVHLKSIEWDCKNFGIVYLCSYDQRFKMRYIGFGNVEGNLALTLEIHDSRFYSVRNIADKITNQNNEYWLERE